MSDDEAEPHRWGNVLLDALTASPGLSENLAPGEGLQVVELEAYEVVHEAGVPVEYVYFPLSAVFGLLAVLPDGPDVEVMPVGNEGVVGLPAVLGDSTSPHRALCQVPGQAVRLPAAALRRQIDDSEPSRHLLGKYAQMIVVLLTARVVCHQRHTAQQRCADWLLRRFDQVSGQPFPVTQQFLASMLGLRRGTVSAVATRLQDLELISYRYGQVQVRDHAGLEQLACSCYQLFRHQIDEVTGTTATPNKAHSGNGSAPAWVDPSG